MKSVRAHSPIYGKYYVYSYFYKELEALFIFVIFDKQILFNFVSLICDGTRNFVGLTTNTLFLVWKMLWRCHY